MFFPSVYLGVTLIELIASFLFSVGFVFFGLFYSSLFSYKPYNIKGSSFFNYQGFDIGNYFIPMILMIVAFGIIAFFFWFFNEKITLIAMSLIGVVFIATNKIWLEKISGNFEKNKYRRLEYFKEK